MSFFENAAWNLQRTKTKLTRMRMQRGLPRHFELYLPYVRGKKGLEIGGPSEVLKKGGPVPIYPEVGSLDNCDFSQSTTWAVHADSFVFHRNKPAGRILFCEGSALAGVPDSTYDFLVSLHNLEHFANPVKALEEW